MKYLIPVFAAAVLSLSACSPKDNSSDTPNMAAKSEGITIEEARILPPFPGRDTAASYFKIINHGAANKLVSVSSPLSKQVEIHNHIEDKGVMKMRRVDGVNLAQGQTLEFKPGSYHVMMFKVKVGDNVMNAPLTLTFANGETATITAPIEGREPAKTSGQNHH